MKSYLQLIAVSFCFILPLLASAEENPIEKDTETEAESPWLLTPTLSSDPKLGSTLGAMGAYLYKFDEESPTSTIGVMASYSDTDSSIYGVFGRAYFSADQHRMNAGAMKGKIENDYEDFLGTGFDAITTDDLEINFISYAKRLKQDWFLGVQFIDMQFETSSKDRATQIILEAIGLNGFSSNGLGLMLERDTRDSQNSPQSGSYFKFNNIAFRESLGGDVDFDTYTADYRKFMGHGEGHVLAFNVHSRWTDDAPKSGYSSVKLRGYTQGEYLAPHAVTFEVEERYSLGGKWGATAFLGAACLYGDGENCGQGENWFPAAGAGVTYMLKAQERMVIRAEVAVGEGTNRAFYIQFGNAF